MKQQQKRKEASENKTQRVVSLSSTLAFSSLLFSSCILFFLWGLGVYCFGHPKRSPEKRFLALLRWPGTRRRNCGNAITWMFQSLTLLNPQRFTLPNNFRSSLNPRRKVFKFLFNIISVTVMWVLLLLFYVFWFSV